MSLRLYNTFSKDKQEFKPIEPKHVKMYVCGPTVYDLLHIGNFRGPIFFNFVRNWLEYSGNKVTYVYNFTDVDDKIIKRAIDEGVDSLVISEKYIHEFKQDFARMNLRSHDHNPKVTEYMPQIITFIQDLLKNGKAYEVEGEVFFSVDTFAPYGHLSGKKLDELESGIRVEVDQRKKNPQDFVLWKPSKPQEPWWNSPWGQGRPGWHIECSAMIQSILGDSIDIHGGGIDLIFPHHENEIAQGEGRTGCKYCNYWMHNNFISLNDEKMSKSLGNVIKARHFMDEYDPEILKYLFLSVHYRSMLAISDDKINQVIAALKRIYSALEEAQFVLNQSTEKTTADAGFIKLLKEMDGKIKKSVDDDFNSAELISYIFEVVRAFNALNLSKKKVTPDKAATANLFIQWLKGYGAMLALFEQSPAHIISRLDDIMLKKRNVSREQVENLMQKRKDARTQKDFAASDRIRDELVSLGIELYDGGSMLREWSVKVSDA
jgi:cysteinyl-tRNA synthetase